MIQPTLPGIIFLTIFMTANLAVCCACKFISGDLRAQSMIKTRLIYSIKDQHCNPVSKMQARKVGLSAARVPKFLPIYAKNYPSPVGKDKGWRFELHHTICPSLFLWRPHVTKCAFLWRDGICPRIPNTGCIHIYTGSIAVTLSFHHNNAQLHGINVSKQPRAMNAINSHPTTDVHDARAECGAS